MVTFQSLMISGFLLYLNIIPFLSAGSTKVCAFCEQGVVNEDVYGKMLTKGGLSAHYFCMVS